MNKVHQEMINQVWCESEPRRLTSLRRTGTQTVSQTPSPNQASYSSSDSVNYFIMDFALCARDIVLLEQKKTPQNGRNKGF